VHHPQRKDKWHYEPLREEGERRVFDLLWAALRGPRG